MLTTRRRNQARKKQIRRLAKQEKRSARRAAKGTAQKTA